MRINNVHHFNFKMLPDFALSLVIESLKETGFALMLLTYEQKQSARVNT